MKTRNRCSIAVRCGPVAGVPSVAMLAMLAMIVGSTFEAASRAQDFGGLGSELLQDPLEGQQEGAGFGQELTTGDYDGDGVMDLTVAAPSFDLNGLLHIGRGYVYLGSAQGLVYNAASGVGISLARSGTAAASGDFDNNGRDELLLGIPGLGLGGSPSGAGAVQVSVYSLSQFKVLPTVPLLEAPDPATDDAFGSALAVGDFNADSYDDVAIGVPGYDVVIFNPDPSPISNAGAIAIAYGSALGLQPVEAADLFTREDFIGFSSQVDEELGLVLQAGDFNGDGKDDLAIGSPQRTVSGVTDAGEVLIMEGATGGLATTSISFVLADFDPLLLGTEPARFGSALAAGDFNRVSCNPVLLNCRDDLAMGAPGQPLMPGSVANDVGIVVVAPGAASGPTTAGAAIFQQGHLAGGHTTFVGDRFGGSLLAGFFDDQPGEDLVIGVPWDDVENVGTIHVIPGSAALLDLAEAQTIVMTTAQTAMNQQYGESLAAADFDDNGDNDLVIGAPNWGPDGGGPAAGGGAVEVLYGGPFFADGFESGNTSSWSSTTP